jgi:hypothetical protein
MARPGKLITAFGAVGALGLMLPACSLAGPSDHAFTAVDAKPTSRNAKPSSQQDKNEMEQASKACKYQTRDKGIKSLLAIVSSMRPGAVDEDYIACMKSQGYTVAK